jgi:transposase
MRLRAYQINFLKKEGLTQKKIANLCHRNERTIRRWKTEPPYKRKHKPGRKAKIPFKDFVSLMSHILKENLKGNNLTQREMVDYLLKEKGLSVSQQAVSRALKKYDITHKKITYHSTDQLRFKKEIKQFIETTRPLLATVPFSALDECSFHLNEVPRRSYATKGWRVNSRKPSKRGENHTLILCIQNVKSKGVIHWELIQGGMKSKNFHEFLTNLKLPIDKEHYLMMDNLSAHHANQSCLDLGLTSIKELLISKNIQPTYLPSYSPELNPTELCFNFIRKSIEGQKPRTTEELKLAIDKAITLLQEKDMTEYFRHCFDLFDENGILLKRKTKGVSQIIRLFKRQHLADWRWLRKKEKDDKKYYIRRRKRFRKNGHLFRVE